MRNQLVSNVLVAVLSVLLTIFLWKSCSGPINTGNVAKSQGNGIRLVAEHHDTIKPPDTIYVFKTNKVKVHDSIKIPIYLTETAKIDSLNQLCLYQRTYIDSLVDERVIIYTTDNVTGFLNSHKVSYKLKVPLIINNNYYYTTDPKFELFSGIEVGGSKERANLSLIIGAQVKKTSVHYNYDLINKEHRVGITRTIYRKDPKIAIK